MTENTNFTNNISVGFASDSEKVSVSLTVQDLTFAFAPSLARMIAEELHNWADYVDGNTDNEEESNEVKS